MFSPYSKAYNYNSTFMTFHTHMVNESKEENAYKKKKNGDELLAFTIAHDLMCIHT